MLWITIKTNYLKRLFFVYFFEHINDDTKNETITRQSTALVAIAITRPETEV